MGCFWWWASEAKRSALLRSILSLRVLHSAEPSSGPIAGWKGYSQRQSPWPATHLSDMATYPAKWHGESTQAARRHRRMAAKHRFPRFIVEASREGLAVMHIEQNS